jgi:hypothetical protein
MRCEFCITDVVGRSDVMTAPGLGPAHIQCFLNFQFKQRVFRSIDITTLADDELAVLEELVKTERNQRNKPADDHLDFELF